MTESQHETDLVPKRNSTSIVWTWFGFSPEDKAQTKVICKVCRDAVRTSDGNTTNLFNHVRRQHPNHYADSQTKRRSDTWQPEAAASSKLTQPTVTQSVNKGTPYEKTSKRWREITEAVTYYLVKDMIPIKNVENEGFKRLFKVVDPRYDLPSRKFFSSTAIPRLYSECREKIEREVRTVRFFAAASDMWSSRTSEPYLSLTIHYIHDWKLCSATLQTTYIPEDHTGELIAQGLRDALQCWGLKEENMTCMTIDGGTNMAKALELNNWTCLPCFGYILHLAIEKSVKDPRVTRAVSVCKKVVSAFSFSWKTKQDLSQAQTEMRLPQQKLIRESPSRWRSKLAMIERVSEQEKAISHVLQDEKTKHLMPTWQDTDVMESIKKALCPLRDFTDALSEEEYVSVSYVKAVLHLLKVNLLNLDDEYSELTNKIKTTVLNYLTEKYQDPTTDALLDMASLLDPRFKSQYIDSDKKESVQARAASELESMLDAQAHHQPPSTSWSPEIEEQSLPKKAKKKTLAGFFKTSGAVSSTATMSAPPTLREAIDGELKAYLSTPNANSEMDPLKWWRLNEGNFPRVGQLARKYLCIPATSAPSERVFSTGGNKVTCQRATLKPDKVDKLVFLAKNL
ncbi:E3 SUMO-protein ligase ZBED1 isoform X1 [Vanacampus margaritifer]